MVRQCWCVVSCLFKEGREFHGRPRWARPDWLILDKRKLYLTCKSGWDFLEFLLHASGRLQPVSACMPSLVWESIEDIGKTLLIARSENQVRIQYMNAQKEPYVWATTNKSDIYSFEKLAGIINSSVMWNLWKLMNEVCFQNTSWVSIWRCFSLLEETSQ